MLNYRPGPDAMLTKSTVPRCSKYLRPMNVIYATLFGNFVLAFLAVDGAMERPALALAVQTGHRRMLTAKSVCKKDQQAASNTVRSGKNAKKAIEKIVQSKHCLYAAQAHKLRPFLSKFRKAQAQLAATKHAGKRCHPHIEGTLSTLRIPPLCQHQTSPKHVTHPTAHTTSPRHATHPTAHTISPNHVTHPTVAPVQKAVPTLVPVNSNPVLVVPTPVPIDPRMAPAPVPIYLTPTPVPIDPRMAPTPVPVDLTPTPVPVTSSPVPVTLSPVPVTPLPMPVAPLPTPSNPSCSDGAPFKPGPSLSVTTDTGGVLRSFVTFNPTNGDADSIAYNDNEHLYVVPFSLTTGFGKPIAYDDALGTIMGARGRLDGGPYESLVYSQFDTDAGGSSTINVLRSGPSGVTLQNIYSVDYAGFDVVKFGAIKAGMVDNIFAASSGGSASDQILVFLNDGTGDFTLKQTLALDSDVLQTLDMVVTDVTQDGINDIVTLVAKSFQDNIIYAVGVSPGNGDGTFALGTTTLTGDIFQLSAMTSSAATTSALADAGGSEAPAPAVSDSQQPTTLTVADVGGSLGPDVFVSVAQGSAGNLPYIDQLQNLGGGNLAAGKKIFVGTGGNAAVSADFRASGHIDFITTGYLEDYDEISTNMDFHPGAGSGKFGPPTSIATLGNVTNYMSLANLQGQGPTDLAMADGYGNILTFLRCP